MSVRLGLLAVLAEGDQHAYELRRRFEERTGGAWPLNLGQVSSTLGRLERNGSVELLDGAISDRMQRDVRRYRLTAVGRDELRGWLERGVDRTAPGRDELGMKVALALSDPHVDADAFLQAQRRSLLAAMRDLTRLWRHRDAGTDGMWELTLERMLLVTEAELTWLDRVAERVVRTAAGPARAARADDIPAHDEQHHR